MNDHSQMFPVLFENKFSLVHDVKSQYQKKIEKSKIFSFDFCSKDKRQMCSR